MCVVCVCTHAHTYTQTHTHTQERHAYIHTRRIRVRVLHTDHEYACGHVCECVCYRYQVWVRGVRAYVCVHEVCVHACVRVCVLSLKAYTGARKCISRWSIYLPNWSVTCSVCIDTHAYTHTHTHTHTTPHHTTHTHTHTHTHTQTHTHTYTRPLYGTSVHEYYAHKSVSNLPLRECVSE